MIIRCQLPRDSHNSTPRPGPGLAWIGSAAIAVLIGGCVIDPALRMIGPDLPVSTAPTDQTEPSVAIDPANTDRILVGAIEVDAQQCRYMASADGGQTWTEGLLDTADRSFCTDPSVAFDANGNAYFAGFFYDANNANTGIGVAKSTDGGASFGTPVIFGGGAGGIFEPKVDKPYIAIDTTDGPRAGNVYVAWNTVMDPPIQTSCADLDGNGTLEVCFRSIWLGTSTDGGQTFGIPLRIAQGSNNFGASVAVAPNGDAYVAWRRFHATAIGVGWVVDDKIMAARVDAGTGQVQPAVTVADIGAQHPGAGVQGALRATRYPIIGVSHTPGTEGDVYVVFADDPPSSVSFTDPDSTANIVASGVNNWGRIVGHAISDTTTTGFFHTIQEFKYINITDTVSSVASDLTDDNTIVGYFMDRTAHYHGFVLDGSGFSSGRTPVFQFDYPLSIHTKALGINNAGAIVGSYSDIADSTHGFLLENDSFTAIDYPGAAATEARGINEQGVIVGIYLDNGGAIHGFKLDSGTFETIDHTSGGDTVLNDINSAGLIVGSRQDTGGKDEFVYDGTTFSSLAGAAGDAEALGISDSRQIVGRTGSTGFINYGPPSQEIWMAHSDDRGVSWTALHRVNDDMRGDQFDPWMATGPAGQVHIAWLDRRNDPQNFLYDAYYAASSDGGQTFTKNLRLTTASSDPRLAVSVPNNTVGFIGDYIGIAANPEIAHIVWPDLSNAATTGQDIHHATVSCDFIDLGDGTVADTCANLTWLQDANYAETVGDPDTGEAVDGAMSWDAAYAWVRDLEFVGYDDWRLPEGRFPDYNCDAGATVFIGINCVGSELGFLYYSRGITAATPLPFANIPDNPAWYWGSRYNSPFFSSTISNPGRAWGFKMQSGEMGSANAGITTEIYAWPVRDIKITDTFPGGNSEVRAVPDVSVTFTNVTAGGATTVNVDDQNPQADPAMVFIPPFYQIGSTATYDPAMLFCLDYDPADLPVGQVEANLQIAQLITGSWVTLPVASVDTTEHRVCAPSTLLGWVVIVGT